MALTTTAETGQTTPDDKTAIGYAVGVTDIAQVADQNTAGYSATLTVEADDAAAFVYEVLGYSELQGTSLHRVLPEPCGIDSRAYAMRMERAQATEVGANNAAGWPTFGQISYRVEYAIPLYDVLEDDEVTYEHERFCVWKKNPTVQNEKIPGGSFKFINASKTDLNEVGVRTGQVLELSCKWLDVPRFDYAKLSGLFNKINSSAIVLDGVSYDAYKVLFAGASEEPRVNGVGFRTRDIDLKFLVRLDARTWNMFWCPRDGAYVEVSSNGEAGGTRPFTTANLLDIWTFT